VKICCASFAFFEALLFWCQKERSEVRSGESGMIVLGFIMGDFNCYFPSTFFLSGCRRLKWMVSAGYPTRKIFANAITQQSSITNGLRLEVQKRRERRLLFGLCCWRGCRLVFDISRRRSMVL
jgi:hypothetical protein